MNFLFIFWLAFEESRGLEWTVGQKSVVDSNDSGMRVKQLDLIHFQQGAGSR